MNKIMIYGVGRVGRLLEKLLVDHGVIIEGFIDINAERRHYKEYKIITPDEIVEPEKVMIIIALTSINVVDSVKVLLENIGCPNVMFFADKKIQDRFCNKKCGQCPFAKFCKQEIRDRKEKLHLNQLVISVTTKCTLNCKNCIALMPEIKRVKVAKDFSIENFAQALKILEKYISEINEYQVSGGEPLLNPNLDVMLNMILNSTINFKIINIITNGTVPIAQKLLDLFRNKRINVIVDNYGDKLKEKQCVIIQNNIESLKKHGCNYIILDNTEGVWYDCGDFTDRQLSEKEIEERFKTCVMKECVILTPTCYLGRCGRYMMKTSMLGGFQGGEKNTLIYWMRRKI